MASPESTNDRGRGVLSKIRGIKPFLMGSVTTTLKRCGKPRCRCASEGPIHETTLLTWKEENHTHTLHVPVDLREEVSRCVEEGKLLRRLMTEMSACQREFLVEKRVGKKKDVKP
jgi:hypothetical protein